MKKIVLLLSFIWQYALMTESLVGQVVIRDSIKISLRGIPSPKGLLQRPNSLASSPYLPCGPLPPGTENESDCSITVNEVVFYGDTVRLPLGAIDYLPCYERVMVDSNYCKLAECAKCNFTCLSGRRDFISLRNVSFTQGLQHVRVVDAYTGAEAGYDLQGLQNYHNSSHRLPVFFMQFNQQEPRDYAVVSFRVENPNIGAMADHNYFVVQPKFTLHDRLEENEVRNGQSLRLEVEAHSQCGPPRFGGHPEAGSYWPLRSPALPASETYQAEIISGREFGVLVNNQTAETGTTLSGIPHLHGSLTALEFLAIGETPSDTVEVRVHVSTSNDRTVPVELAFQILPSSLVVSFNPQAIAPSDTAAIVIQRKNSAGELENFPSGQLFEIGIIQGSDYGAILSPLPTPVNATYFRNFEQPFQFVAASNIDADSVLVQIRVGIPPEATGMASGNHQNEPAVSSKTRWQDDSYVLTSGNGEIILSDIPESDFVYSDFAKAIITIKQELDHFAVTITPDTIDHADTATVVVQAKDKNDNDIPMSDATPIDFALDTNGELLGNLIAPNGSQAKSLAGIPYGDARTGKVKYLANGELPDSTKQILVMVSKSDDASKSGIGSVFVEGFALTLDIPDPKEIWPTLPAGRSGGNPQNRNRKENITVAVTQNNQRLENQSVTITTRIIFPSGGHDHADQPPSDSLGVFRTSSDTMRGSITSSTDANGEIGLSYQAPIFGGRIELTATVIIEEDTLAAKDTLIVRVPGLDELDASPLYELVGAPGNHDGTNDPCRANPPTSQHNRNHYGTQALRTAIQNVAASYDSLHPGSRLRINDMSLEWGGLFDNQNNWRYIVGATHGEHRIGRNADIGFSGIDQDGRCLRLNLIDLRRFILAYTTDTAFSHSDHYHIRMR